MSVKPCYPYLLLMRWHRPIGFFLLLWPTLWGLWIAGKGVPDWHITLIFILGVFIMRSAGCVINDIADRKIDGHVERTQERPLATGAISTKAALILFVALCTCAFILVLQLNLKSILLAFVALGLAILYPFMKRYTYWPQVVLGMAWYMGIPMTFAALTDHVPAVAWLIYLIAVLWTVVYDTMYAIADRDDDLKIGVKSTAILFGRFDKLIIGIFQIKVLVLLIYLGTVLSFAQYYYWTLLFAASLSIYQQYLIQHHQPQACIAAFLNNNWFGAVVFMGIAVSS